MAKISPFWLIRASRREERSERVLNLHRKYGDFVRIAPNHVSIDCPDALAEVYSHKARLSKGPYYDAFMQGPLNVFNMRDHHEHSKRKRILNPAFSESSLTKFEPELDSILFTWKQQLMRRAASEPGVKVNMALWC